MGRERLLTPRRKACEKPGALSGHPRLIRQCGVTPLMYQYGETVTFYAGEMAHGPARLSPVRPKNRPQRRLVKGTSASKFPIRTWQSFPFRMYDPADVTAA